ncbi:MAG TPA: aldose 1-epimerase family protein [Prolixibacteraceae bacterium]|nr:aldose 1-epimerase family protein [Prolixibacteraceae bacterium]HPR85881.1 aldose 1-epimerase family protein [Prolixibacteraceae bacterium]
MTTKEFNKRKMLKYVGDLNQVFGIKEYALTSGKAKGVKAFDVKTGSGLEFTVLADRCLDISGLSFKGTNCSYISKTGIVAPEYYEENGVGFLRSFTAGFLTTCGLRNVGPPCEKDGEPFSMHGRIANTPGEEVSATTGWVDDIPVLTINGKMREARVFGENLVLSRKITCKYFENKITIENTVENLGFRKEALMLLFHFNMGYPLLGEDSVLVTPTEKLTPRDPEAEIGKDKYNLSQPPTPDYREQVFYHSLKADKNGATCVALINKKLELGVAIHFNKNQLFNFTQWKQMGEGEYVMGMEPCNCYVGGRVDPRNNETLEYLEPGDIRRFDLTIELLNGTKELDTLIKSIKDLDK